MREQEEEGQPQRRWNIIHRLKYCCLNFSGTLRRSNTLEVHLLISHNKEPGIVPRVRGRNEDEGGGRMVQSLPSYQGFMWNMEMEMPL